VNGFVRAAAGLRGADFFCRDLALDRRAAARDRLFAVLLVGKRICVARISSRQVCVRRLSRLNFLGRGFLRWGSRRAALVGAFFAAACFAGLRIFVCFAVAVFDVELLRADDGMVAADVFFAVFLPDFVPVDFGGAFSLSPSLLSCSLQRCACCSFSSWPWNPPRKRKRGIQSGRPRAWHFSRVNALECVALTDAIASLDLR
jgi:hypothetical protein